MRTKSVITILVLVCFVGVYGFYPWIHKWWANRQGYRHSLEAGYGWLTYSAYQGNMVYLDCVKDVTFHPVSKNLMEIEYTNVRGTRTIVQADTAFEPKFLRSPVSRKDGQPGQWCVP